MKKFSLFYLCGVLAIAPLRLWAIGGEEKEEEKTENKSDQTAANTRELQIAAVQKASFQAPAFVSTTEVIEEKTITIEEQKEDLFDLTFLESRLKEILEVTCFLQEKEKLLGEAELQALLQQWKERCERYQDALKTRLENNNNVGSIAQQLNEPRLEKLAELVETCQELVERLRQHLENFSKTEARIVTSGDRKSEEKLSPNELEKEVSKSSSAEKPKNKKANRELTEKALQRFVEHYYPFEWLREYLIEMYFKMGSLRLDAPLVRNFIFCVKACREIFPTAKGLASIEGYLQEVKKIMESQGYYPSFEKDISGFCRDARYFLFYLQKAKGAEQLPHGDRLAKLWRKVAVTIATPSWHHAYASAKKEEAKILGYPTEEVYWERVIQDLKKQKLANKISDDNMLPIIQFQEDQKNLEDFIQHCKYQAEEASKKNNKELAALWEQVANATTQKNLDQASDLFLAAWSLTKANDPHQYATAIWRTAADYFQKKMDNQNIHSSSTARELAKLAQDITITINKGLELAHSYKKKGSKETDSEMAELWARVASFFEDASAHLARSALIKDHDESAIRREIDGLKSKTRQIQRAAFDKPNSFDQKIKELSEELQKVKGRLSLISRVRDDGFPELADLLIGKLDDYKKAIITCFQGAEQQARSNWDSITGIGNQNSSAASKELLHYYARLFSSSEPFLEKIHHYAQKTFSVADGNTVQDPASVAALYRETAQALAKSGEAVIIHAPAQPPYSYFSTGYVARNLLQDHEQSMEYGEKALKEEAPEIASLFHKLRNFSLKRISWREKTLDNKEENFWNQAIGTILKADSVLQEAIRQPQNREKLGKLGEELREAADLFAQAAEASSASLASFYFQAAHSLATKKLEEMLTYSDEELDQQANTFRSISSQFIKAAELWTQGKETPAAIEGQKGELLLLLTKTHQEDDQRERVERLLKMADHPKLIDPPRLSLWKEINSRLKKVIDDQPKSNSSETTWEQKKREAEQELHQWNGEVVDYFTKALESALEGNVADFHSWHKIVEEIQPALALKEKEIVAAKERKDPTLRSLKKQAEVIREKVNKLIRETEKKPHSKSNDSNPISPVVATTTSTTTTSIPSAANSLPALSHRQNEYGLTIQISRALENFPGAKLWKQAEDQLKRARDYHVEAAACFSTGNQEQSEKWVEAATLATDAVQKLISAAEEKKQAVEVTASGESNQQKAISHSRQAQQTAKEAQKLVKRAEEAAKEAQKFPSHAKK